MDTKKWILVILVAAGLTILLIPDQGKPLIILNKKHGPSLQDLVGLMLLMISWIVSCVVVAREWKVIKSKTGNRNSTLLLMVYCLAITGVVLSLLFSSEFLLWSSAAIGSLINILFIIYAFKER